MTIQCNGRVIGWINDTTLTFSLYPDDLKLKTEKVEEYFPEWFIDEYKNINKGNRYSIGPDIINFTTTEDFVIDQMHNQYNEPVIPNQWSVSIIINGPSDSYGDSEDIIIPWNYSNISGRNTQELIPCLLKVLDTYCSISKKIFFDNIERAKTEKKKQKESAKKYELKQLEKLAKKYNKTIV